MSQEILATKHFTTADQENFAKLSGDRNPMHMDPVAARRTQAGAPVVHGVHTLMWSLDSLARRHPDLPDIATMRIRFDKLVYVGDSVEAVLTHVDASGLQLEVMVEGAIAFRLKAAFGLARVAPAEPAVDLPFYAPKDGHPPLDLDFGEMAERSGWIGFALPSAVIGRAFPDAARAWGARRVAALACTTYLVGMVCPGLHSIFGGLALNFCEDTGVSDGVTFKVTRTDTRFRLVRMEMAGSGLSGIVESFSRHPPVAQQASVTLKGIVGAREFTGSTALVVGGSRGLGELTAKLLAAGGARLIITYATGQADAERLCAEIVATGGLCETLHYDVRLPAGPQLAALYAVPDTLYYCATPPIFRRKADLFVPERLAEFLAFYVTGFYDLCEALRQRRPAGISMFYPSSIAVEERPADMAEYAMSKMAGEMLCADMLAHQQPIAIEINRLPRLPTDQTATLTEVATADPVIIMLPILRAVEERRFHLKTKRG